LKNDHALPSHKKDKEGGGGKRASMVTKLNILIQLPLDGYGPFHLW